MKISDNFHGLNQCLWVYLAIMAHYPSYRGHRFVQFWVWQWANVFWKAAVTVNMSYSVWGCCDHLQGSSWAERFCPSGRSVPGRSERQVFLQTRWDCQDQKELKSSRLLYLFLQKVKHSFAGTFPCPTKTNYRRFSLWIDLILWPGSQRSQWPHVTISLHLAQFPWTYW